MSVTQQEKDELRREILEDDYRDSLIEANMYSDLNFAIEQLDLDEAMEAVEEIAKKLNGYGHEISVSELIKDYY
jgi:Mg/Co/Ni transporter MgtE